MSENKFTVDLGSVKLTDDQRQKINSSIQKAVSAELAHMLEAGKIVLIPVRKWVKGPITDGIISMEVNEALLNRARQGT